MENKYVVVPLEGIFSQYLEFSDDGMVGNHLTLDDELARVVNYYRSFIFDGNVMDKDIMLVVLRRDEDNIFYEVSTNEKIICDGTNLLCDVSDVNRYGDELYSILDYPLMVVSDLFCDVDEEDRLRIEDYCRNCCKDTLKKRFKKMKKDAWRKNMFLFGFMEEGQIKVKKKEK